MALLSRLCLSPPRVSRHRFGRIDALRSLGRIRGIGKDMGNTRTKTVTPALEGPLDRAVRGLFGISWGKARGWISAGKVRLCAEIVTEPTTPTAAGNEIVFEEAARRPRVAALTDDRVVYADAHLVVIAKPAGISTVPYEGDEPATDTLEGRVRAWLERRPAASTGGRPNLGVVQRLDKETTGLIVFTRTWLAKSALASQFRRHSVHRRYLAIAHGDVPTRTIRSVLIADRGDGLRGSARGSTVGGRLAVTHVERLEALRSATLVACRLETGRTHQIRIHLSEAGHPIVGDRVYVRRYPGPLLDAPRLMLHASELGFVHPATERAMHWELPMPDDMRRTWQGLRR
jgi:23S rRNA pseudouridine1911/1915/1917 synthase